MRRSLRPRKAKPNDDGETESAASKAYIMSARGAQPLRGAFTKGNRGSKLFTKE
jgi:hypothetical protein